MHIKRKSNRDLLKLLILFISTVIPWIIGVFIIREVNEMKLEMKANPMNFSADSTMKVDHSKFLSLQQEFNTPQEVSDACLTCHNMTAQDVMKSSHWTWTRDYKMEDGSHIVEYDSMGNITYHTQKGTFQWANNVEPEYLWFNGKASHYVLGEQVDTTGPVQINTLHGDYLEKESIIVPVKVHRGKHIYDPVNNTMIQAHFFGKDSTAFWKGFILDISNLEEA